LSIALFGTSAITYVAAAIVVAVLGVVFFLVVVAFVDEIVIPVVKFLIGPFRQSGDYERGWFAATGFVVIVIGLMIPSEATMAVGVFLFLSTVVLSIGFALRRRRQRR
jgi:hypothetical protein